MIVHFNIGEQGSPPGIFVQSRVADTGRIVQWDQVKSLSGQSYHVLHVRQAFPIPSPYNFIELEVVLTEDDMLKAAYRPQANQKSITITQCSSQPAIDHKTEA